MTVTIEPVAYADKSVLGRLLQLYLYDFTEFQPRELNAHGEFEYRYLDLYWAPDYGEKRYPFYIRSEGSLAGLAMVRFVNGVNVMSEFFVLRPYRRRGVGAAAARAVFAALPGRWLVPEVTANLAAQAFLHGVIDGVTGVRFDEVRDENGLTQRFTT